MSTPVGDVIARLAATPAIADGAAAARKSIDDLLWRRDVRAAAADATAPPTDGEADATGDARGRGGGGRGGGGRGGGGRGGGRAEVGGMQPYEDRRVRQAISMAVDNAVILELGYAGRGIMAENHHVGPAHPEYVSIGAPKHDPAGARALMEEAGMMDFEHELISIDGGYRKDTADAVAAGSTVEEPWWFREIRS